MFKDFVGQHVLLKLHTYGSIALCTTHGSTSHIGLHRADLYRSLVRYSKGRSQFHTRNSKNDEIACKISKW
jgi:hypothetical protein